MEAAWRALKLAWDGCGWIAYNLYRSALALAPYASDHSKNVFNLSYFFFRQNLGLRMALLEYRRKTKVGGSAPNPVVVREDDETTCRMLDAASKGRPLVLNFGSCS
ncbi:type I iodothyronine deiodinase-like [Hyalella azteca]|uniref:Type I iodothyronine deiodinase-like n=1 Tax=Hyalella azteca TaxID=294128 RepID=A0A979FGQ4_HYAAZ|nr:type I iodothyronine deiodinase-like [Hyalella azteca]